MKPTGKEQAEDRATQRIRGQQELQDPGQLFNAIVGGDRTALSKAITLTESTVPAHRRAADEVLSRIKPTGVQTYRVAVTGVPGAGKSSFIERFGLFAIGQGKRVAVLAVDPSSPVGGGSILGDKTRMTELSAHPQAFVRPSPSGGASGGIGVSTMEAVMLCEAAGYEYIFIETVGVGQGEVAVSDVCDFFLLLALARAGDQLQGIKRGIMEMADALVITKADGDNKTAARLARAEYLAALHLLPPKESGWQPVTELVSALDGTGIEAVWEILQRHREWITGRGMLLPQRREQEKNWIRKVLDQEVLRAFHCRPDIISALGSADRAIEAGGHNVFEEIGKLRALLSPDP